MNVEVYADFSIDNKMFVGLYDLNKVEEMLYHNQHNYDKIKHCLRLSEKFLREEYKGIFEFYILLCDYEFKMASKLYKEEYLEFFDSPNELKKVLLPYLI